jgi:hypothetical protein
MERRDQRTVTKCRERCGLVESQVEINSAVV